MQRRPVCIQSNTLKLPNCLVAATRATQETTTLSVAPNALASASISGSVTVYSGVFQVIWTRVSMDKTGHNHAYLLIIDPLAGGALLDYLTPLIPVSPFPKDKPPVRVNPRDPSPWTICHLEPQILVTCNLWTAICQGNYLVWTGNSLVAPPLGRTPSHSTGRPSLACSSRQIGPPRVVIRGTRKAQHPLSHLDKGLEDIVQ